MAYLSLSKRSQKLYNCEIETGHRSAMYAHLRNIAYETGEALVYDDKKRLFENSIAANALIKPEYRSPWNFPVL